MGKAEMQQHLPDASVKGRDAVIKAKEMMAANGAN